MKRHLLRTIVAIMISTSFFAVYANNVRKYEAYETNTKIFFIGREEEFNLPLVTINDRVYVPLREAAERNGIKVKWNEESNTIRLYGYFAELDVKKIFEEIFEFSLPETAEVMYHCYFVEEGEPRLTAKISFEKKDLEYIKNGFLGDPSKIWTENLDFTNFPPHFWEAEPIWMTPFDFDNVICIYTRTTRGVYAHTVHYRFYIEKAADDSCYYLYVDR